MQQIVKRNYLREREDSGASEPHFCYTEIRQASEPTSWLAEIAGVHCDTQPET